MSSDGGYEHGLRSGSSPRTFRPDRGDGESVMTLNTTDYVRLFREKWRALVIVTVIFVAAAALVTLLQPKVYAFIFHPIPLLQINFQKMRMYLLL